MKRFAAIFSLLMLCQPVAFAMGPEHTGSWFNQNENGHGFSIEYGQAGNGTPLVVVYWYVYDKDGNPVFLTGTGHPDSTGVDITFYAHYGMKFGTFDPLMHQELDGGVARFTFQDDKNGTFEYFPSTWTKENFGHSQHQMPITKLFAVTHPYVKPPSGEPVPLFGLWSGRMVYDRAYSGNATCYDADVLISVTEWGGNKPGYIVIGDLSVHRDGGSTSSDYPQGFIQNRYIAGSFRIFSSISAEFTLRFDDYGQAVGTWREYSNGDCYGTWFFQKE